MLSVRRTCLTVTSKYSERVKGQNCPMVNYGGLWSQTACQTVHSASYEYCIAKMARAGGNCSSNLIGLFCTISRSECALVCIVLLHGKTKAFPEQKKRHFVCKVCETNSWLISAFLL